MRVTYMKHVGLQTLPCPTVALRALSRHSMSHKATGYLVLQTIHSEAP